MVFGLTKDELLGVDDCEHEWRQAHGEWYYCIYCLKHAILRIDIATETYTIKEFKEK